MSYILLSKENSIATLTLNRGKVNALIEAVLDEFNEYLDQLENDDSISAIILTGQGKFFGAGFYFLLPHLTIIGSYTVRQTNDNYS